MHEIPATAFAFAAILGDGLVVTWGAAGSGGGCDSQGLHISKAQVHANRHAFFAFLAMDLLWPGVMLPGIVLCRTLS